MYPLIRLSDHYYLPSYFTVIAVAYCVAILYLHSRSRNLELSSKIAMELAIIIMISGFIGSRLFHIFYELPEYYLENPIDIFKVWQGGFVFYGGALTAVGICLLFLKRKKEPIMQWFDAFAPIAPVTYFLGRFATLLSGSGYGKPTDLPWGIVYPMGTEAPAGVALHPTPIYAMLWEAIIFSVILYLDKKTNFKNKFSTGSLFFLMMTLHGVGRLITEQLRNDLRGEVHLGLTVSSWVSLAIIALGASLLLKLKVKTKIAPPKPS